MTFQALDIYEPDEGYRTVLVKGTTKYLLALVPVDIAENLKHLGLELEKKTDTEFVYKGKITEDVEDILDENCDHMAVIDKRSLKAIKEAGLEKLLDQPEKLLRAIMTADTLIEFLSDEENAEIMKYVDALITKAPHLLDME